MLRTLNIRSIIFASFKYTIQCSVMFFISRSSLWFLFKSPYSLIFFSFLFIFTDSFDITEQENVKYPGAHTLGHLAPYLLGEAHRNRIPYRCAHPPFLTIVLRDMLRDSEWKVVRHLEEEYGSRAIECLSCKIGVIAFLF